MIEVLFGQLSDEVNRIYKIYKKKYMKSRLYNVGLLLIFLCLSGFITLNTEYGSNENIANSEENHISEESKTFNSNVHEGFVQVLPIEAEVKIEKALLCFGNSDGIAIASGINGIPPYSYKWSNGVNQDTATQLSAGIYDITVTDSANDSVVVSLNFSEPPSIEFDLVKHNVLCFGDSTGSILIENANGGTGILKYAWSNGDTTNAIENLPAGGYSVTVTDENFCTSIAFQNISESDSITLEVATTDLTKVDSNDGTAVAFLAGGTGQFTYNWSTGSTLSSIDSLPAGEYSVTVTDSNGCSINKEFNIESPECSFIADLNFANVTCFGANDGEASVDPVGFAQPLSIEWSTGESQFIFVLGLEPGDYAITLTDGNGCVVVNNFTITEPPALELSLDGVFPSCEDTTLNLVTSNIIGGEGPYSYLWSNGSTDSSLENVELGTYGLTATDNKGCTVSDSIVLEFGDYIPPTILAIDSMVVYLDSLGAASISLDQVDLGTSDNCELLTVNLSDSIFSCEDLGMNTIFVIAEDESGNVARKEVSVNIIDNISPYAECISDVVVNVCDSVHYDLPILFDNCDVDSLVLTEGLPSGSIFPEDSTKITYTFYDNSGNEGSCSFYVILTNDLLITIDTVGNATSEIGGMIETTITGGSGSYTFEWIFNDTIAISSEQNISNLEPGTYQLKVIDANGCEALSDTILIEAISGFLEIPKANNYEIFPNPSMDFISIKGDINNNQIGKVTVIGLNGFKKTLTAMGNSSINKYDISALPSGIYFLNISKEDGRFENHKFVKL